MDLPPAAEKARTALPSARKAAIIAVVALIAFSVLFTALVATGVLAQPAVEDFDKGWGEVTNETTEIQAQVTVDNPNPIGIPDVISVEYTASLNDVVLTKRTKSGVGLSTGTNTISLSSQMPNDRIADWWITHVNNDERSTLSIAPEVSGPGVSESLPDRTSSIETELLSSFGTEGEQMTLDDETFLKLGDQKASWGDATAETTPLSFSTTIENAHDNPFTIEGVEYTVKMNGVTLGSGQTSEGLDIEPGSSETLTVDAGLDTQAFGDWWPTHVRNNESSQMTVEMYGLVDRNGTQERVPIRLFADRQQFETDMLDTGETSTESLPTNQTEIQAPTIEDIDRQWGDVTEATTAVNTDVTVENPNTDPEFNDFVRTETTAETVINDVDVGTGSQSASLSAGTYTLQVTSLLDNGKVPTWWARHLNNGEESTVSTTTTTTADIGFTTIDVETPDQTDPTSTFQTDLLAGFNTDQDQSIEDDGQTYLTAEETSAEWGEATPSRAPLQADSTLRNEQNFDIEIQHIDYRVTVGGVELAEGQHQVDTTIEPGQRETIDLPMDLNNSRMDQWWVAHIRNDESSELNVEAKATLNVLGETQVVPLEMFSQQKTIETDILG